MDPVILVDPAAYQPEDSPRWNDWNTLWTGNSTWLLVSLFTGEIARIGGITSREEANTALAVLIHLVDTTAGTDPAHTEHHRRLREIATSPNRYWDWLTPEIQSRLLVTAALS